MRRKSALVLGGGIAGLCAALQLADSGYPVVLVTDEPAIGGKLVSGIVPDSEAACIWDEALAIPALHLGGNLHSSPAVLGSFILRVAKHPNIQLYKQAKLISVKGAVGDFTVEIGEAGTGRQLAKVNTGAVILATGFDMFDASLQAEFGYGRYRNVITSLELERLIAVSRCQGGVHRPSDGKRVENVAFIQCVGSRDMASSREYCSAICCMFTAKEAIMLRELDEKTGVSVFYMDTRSCGKNFEDFLLQAKKLGTRYVRSMAADIKEDPVTEDLSFRYFEAAAERQEDFDLVVLATGIRPPAGLQEVAGMLGVALNDYGFVAVNQFYPVLTNRPGIFVVGGGQGPLEISETLALAGNAATMAAQTLGEPEPEPARERRVDKGSPSVQPRVGVFLCQGGLKAMGADPKVVEKFAARFKDVVFVSEDTMLCTPERITAIKEHIQKHDINRVVAAPCILKTNNLLFQEMLQAAGINRMLIETASVPPQKRGDKKAANSAAAELVAKAVANVKTYESLHWHPEPVVPQALVVGGGLSGIAAALALADQGFKTTLVEKDAQLGGFLRENAAGLEGPELPQVVADLLTRVKTHAKIEILVNSQVVKFNGRQGHFIAMVKGGDSGQEVRQIDPGVVILATGTIEHKPADYFYGSDPRILTGTEARAFLQQGISADKQAGTYALIQCVGSRNEERRYCSRTCCLEAVDNALAIKKADAQAEVYLFYRDLRTPGFFEKRFLEARKAGVIFVQYDEASPPVLTKGPDDSLILSAADSASNTKIELNPGLVILAVPQLAQPDAKELARLFHVQVNPDGFLMEMHGNMGSIAFPGGGIFIAGAAHGPQSVSECLTQAQGVAARAARLLGQRFLLMGGITARVDTDKCAACLTCVRLCPFSVPAINRESKAMGSASISEVECRGCGMCAAECPNKAIELNHYEIDKLRERVDIALAEVSQHA